MHKLTNNALVIIVYLGFINYQYVYFQEEQDRINASLKEKEAEIKETLARERRDMEKRRYLNSKQLLCMFNNRSFLFLIFHFML